MSQKSKLNTEEKVEIIRKYQQGEISLVQAARMRGLGQRQSIDGAHGMKQKGRPGFYHIRKTESIRQN